MITLVLAASMMFVNPDVSPGNLTTAQLSEGFVRTQYQCRILKMPQKCEANFNYYVLLRDRNFWGNTKQLDKALRMKERQRGLLRK